MPSIIVRAAKTFLLHQLLICQAKSDMVFFSWRAYEAKHCTITNAAAAYPEPHSSPGHDSPVCRRRTAAPPSSVAAARRYAVPRRPRRASVVGRCPPAGGGEGRPRVGYYHSRPGDAAHWPVGLNEVTCRGGAIKSAAAAPAGRRASADAVPRAAPSRRPRQCARDESRLPDGRGDDAGAAAAAAAAAAALLRGGDGGRG